MASRLSGIDLNRKIRTISLINPTYTLKPDENIILFDGSGSVANIANGIEVKVEASITGTGDPVGWLITIGVELSWDGGTSWTTTGNVIQLSGETDSTDAVFTLGGLTNLWGRANWSESELNNTNFRVRLTITAKAGVASSTARVDLVTVKVYDKNGIVTNFTSESSPDTNTGDKAPATTGTPLNEWTSGANIKVSDNAYATSTTVNQDLDSSDYSLLGAGVTITLPSAAAAKGKVFSFKKIDSSAAVLTVQPPSGNIDGSASLTLTAQWQYMELFSDGSNWYVLHKTGSV